QKDLQLAIDENVKLKMKEAEATTQINNLSASHKVLRDKLEKYENGGENTEELKMKIESLEKELKDAAEGKAEAQQEKRQLQILSLEVSDYEKKLRDAHGQLEERKAECEKFLDELGSRDKKVEELEKIISSYKDTENKL